MEAFWLTVTMTFILSKCSATELNSNSSQSYYQNNCDPATMVVYRMSLVTNWTEELFPKSYPKWRPPAQWSQVFGQTHNSKHRIFSVGQLSSTALKKFSERGDLLRLSKSISKKSIFDQFTSSAIHKGDGISEQDIFLGDHHTKVERMNYQTRCTQSVIYLNLQTIFIELYSSLLITSTFLVSLLCKIVPSPDWFIGIDSLDLCENGHWIESLNISVDPLDAGTQGGLTFTAPRWRLQVPAPIERITSQHPSHRAASFHYPLAKRLPTIATFRFIKIKEYNLDKEDGNEIASNETDVSNLSDENNETLPENEAYSNSTNSVSLLIEAEKVASNVTEKFKKNDKYFPKLFRPKIDSVITDPEKTNSYTSGNLLKSKLPPRKNAATSSYFRWRK
ncbi:spondin-2-like isoform X1 [Arctopsyche grandis]|uniref:spondin-2-like isoform X1 n=1 Tax=Arctopsyche grandis TaxID=121162 RepID=UPI00406DA26D